MQDAIARFEAARRAWLRQRVLDHLAEHRAPAGTVQIARALGLPHPPVQYAVCTLVIGGELVQVGRGENGKPAYRPVEIGPCEWCGLVSHRLVAGECPSCAARCERMTKAFCGRTVAPAAS
ncbi:MAG: hypothetical protein JJU06_12490 [Ectothiorhodospiraceae bacterium]|nr:hypothetical protein [Ectothiorhodospiraceae bacterium]